jgi:hypothetical protein
MTDQRGSIFKVFSHPSIICFELNTASSRVLRLLHLRLLPTLATRGKISALL